jgi:hypothetical protein
MAYVYFHLQTHKIIYTQVLIHNLTGLLDADNHNVLGTCQTLSLTPGNVVKKNCQKERD